MLRSRCRQAEEKVMLFMNSKKESLALLFNLEIDVYRGVKSEAFNSFYVAFFKKRPLIQRAERWSRLARREIILRRLLFCQAFFFAPTMPKKKADIELR